MAFKLNRRKYDYTVAERTIRFIEAVCIIPEGSHVGQPMRLEQFQKDFILDVFKVDKKTGKRPAREAILSIARKNGKSGLIAAILIACLCGPLAERNAEISSIALTREQASMLFRYAKGYVTMNHRLYDRLKVTDSRKQISDRILGTHYTALSADAKSQLGRSPLYAFWDEAGSFRQDDELYQSLYTGQGAHDNPLFVSLSTEAPSDQDVFSEMIDAAELNPDDESIVLHRYTVPEDADPWDEKNWYLANPALGKFLNLDDMRLAAKKAKAMPGSRSAFFNLRLNQRVDAEESFLSKEAWMDDAHEHPPTFEDLRGLDVSLGIDIAMRRDLSALVFVAENPEVENELIVVPAAFMPKLALPERQEEDKVDYKRWVASGLLISPPGNSLDFDWVAQWMTDVVETYDLNVVTGGADPWKRPHLTKALEDIGSDHLFSEVEDFRQGYISMSPALDCLESAVYEKRLWHGNHPILTWNIANCVVTQDAANNRKLDKSRSYSKIDLAVALAMAVKTLDVFSEKSYLEDEEAEVVFL